MHSPKLSRLSDAARLQALADTELLDSPPDERFDRYTRLAAKLLHAPASAITLLDDRRQFLKSGLGVSEPWASLRETPLEYSLCAYTVATGEPLIVGDAEQHPLVCNSLAVTELGIRAYAGVPLEVDGQPVGVLCVADGSPRSWTEDEVDTLRSLAAALSSEVEHASTRRELREQAEMLRGLTDAAHDPIVTLDGAGLIAFCNEATGSMFRRTRHQLIGSSILSLLSERDRSAHAKCTDRTSGEHKLPPLGQVVQLVGLRSDGEEFPLEILVANLDVRTSSVTLVLRDVTERERATQALRDAEEKLRLAMDNAPIGMAVVGIDGQWLRVNDALCAIVGYSREELLTQDFQRITHPEDLGSDLVFLENLLLGSISSYEMDKRYIHRDGHTVWIHLSVSLVRKADGRPDFFISQILDLTARRAAEAQARMFFEQSLDMLAITSSSGKLDKVNQAWERTLGWSAEELASTPFLDFVHPDDVANTIAEAQSTYAGKPSPHFRNRYRARDGSYHWLEWKSLTTEDGLLFCIARDVTAHVEREQEMRLLERAITAARNGILITDPTRPDNPITYVNPAFERMTGYEASELTGKNCRVLQGPDRDEEGLAEIREAIKDERDCQVVLRNHKKSGELFLNSLSMSPVRGFDGTVTHYVGIAEDITARVEAERREQEQSAIMRAVLQSMNEAVTVINPQGEVLLLNDVAMNLFAMAGHPGAAPDWSSAFGLYLPDQTTLCPKEQVPLERALRGENVEQVELWMRPRAQEQGTWRSITACPVRDHDGKVLGAVEVGRDITARKAMEEEIRRASLTDELTGLYNRRGFALMAEQQMRSSTRHMRPLCLLFIDLNGMKRINDQHGHEAGDDALVETATLLTRTCRSSDLIARLGGDEFVVLTEGDDLDAESLRSRLWSAVGERNERRESPFDLSWSIGLASHHGERTTPITDLLTRADQDMYEVKRKMKSSPSALAS